jgi:tetratricopeptide repeat protein 30
MHLSLSLLNSGSIAEADRSSQLINCNKNTEQIVMLKFSIKLENNDLQACRQLFHDSIEDDPNTIIAHALLEFKEQNYQGALELYQEAFNMIDFEPGIAYNIAICHYKLEQYQEATEILIDIIDVGTKQLLGVAPTKRSETKELQQILNSPGLQRSFLIEAFNLKLAIEFDNEQMIMAKETIDSMPLREEEELDPVTLHNHALVTMDTDTNGCLKKMNFLLGNPPFPPETFGNLLLLYCKHERYHLAADIMAENSQFTFDFLNDNLYDYLDASIIAAANPEDAITKFESLSNHHCKQIREALKQMSHAKQIEDENRVESVQMDLNNAMKMYMPLLMKYAGIYWDREDFGMVESILRKSSDFCNEVEVWRLNFAHSFYSQQGAKFKDSMQYYEKFVKGKSEDELIKTSPIILSNLCVSYLMNNQNEKAERLMEIVEKKDDQSLTTGDREYHPHNCIINLVIGTLYCEKGNFEFGINRICKSMRPYERKLAPDTWHYAKRCFLDLADKIAKQMILLKDEVIDEVRSFLDAVYQHGQNLSPLNVDGFETPKEATIAIEARQLQCLFNRLRQCV